MIIAVTGASGHIGANLSEKLADLGHEVRAMVRSNAKPLEGVKVTMKHGDILNDAFLDDCFEHAEIVFHLAAVISIDGDPDGTVRKVNVDGTRAVVDACLRQKVRRLIHYSSMQAFDQFPLDEPLDETRSRIGSGGSAYDRSKNESELEVRKGITRGLDAVILHPSGVIGPKDHVPSRMGAAFLDFYNGKVGSLVPGGLDWVDVRDVVAASLLAMDKGKCGENYLISGNWASLKQVASIITSVTGKKTPSVVTPYWVLKSMLPLIKLYSKIIGAAPLYTRESIDILTFCNRNIRHDKAEKELGYQSRPLEESIRDVYDWFEKEGYLT